MNDKAATPDTIKKRKARYLASVLVKMQSDVEGMFGADRTPEENAAKQQAQEALWKDTYEHLPLPPPGTTTIMKPELGPYKVESKLEATNRCWMLLKYLRWLVQSKHWTKRFSIEGITESVIVDISQVPQWMRAPKKKRPSAIEKTAEVQEADALQQVACVRPLPAPASSIHSADALP